MLTTEANRMPIANDRKADDFALTSWAKSSLAAATLLSIIAFFSIGWLAIEPADPHGAVTLLGQSASLFVWVELTVLACVVGSLATAIAGKSLPDVGPFAVGVGLTALACRGEPAVALLIERADLTHTFQRGLAFQMLVESIGWLITIACSLFASHLTFRWLFGSEIHSGQDSRRPHRSAVDDLPILSGLTASGDAAASESTQPKTGLFHALIVAACAWGVIVLMFAGVSSRSVVHGQACSLVALAVIIGVWVANMIYPVKSAAWPMLAVLFLVVAGYIGSSLSPQSSGVPAHVAQTNFLRVLPLQFVGTGSAAAITAFWWFCADRTNEQQSAGKSGKSRSKKKAAR